MTSLHQDFTASLKFLHWLYPAGPWDLCAISFDKTVFRGARFDPSTLSECLRWLESYDKFNLYYHVNRPIEDKKSPHASKTDIEEVHFLQIDCDLRPGEAPDDGVARLRESLEKFAHRPSAVISSGGGVNALWRLARVMPAPRDEPDSHAAFIDNIEARNKQLAADLEGDHTFDVSRILRLPGTINRLNEQKVKLGRVPAESQLLWADDSLHELSGFVSAPLPPKNQSASRTSSRERGVTTDVTRTEDLASLNLPPKLMQIIAQGRDPDAPPTGDRGRSEYLYYVCCELARRRVPESVILGIITDGRYGISASVMDKGSGTMRYALRQLERGRAGAIDEDLVRMNDQYAVIQDFGGACVVMIEDRSGDVIEDRRYQKPRDFFAAMDNQKKLIYVSEKKTREIGIGSWWFDHAERRQYRRVVFEPGRDTPGDLNVWESFGVEPRAGDAHLGYLRHVRDNICRGDTERYDYLLKWMARIVQYPATQCMVAVIITGTQGSGKSFFAKEFGSLFGKHFFEAKSDREITGKFNAHLARTIFLLGEEAFDVRDKRHEAAMKSLITSDTLSIEGKGTNLRSGPNYVHLMMLSNADAVVPAGDHERRYFVMRAGDGQRGSRQYFGPIIEDMQKRGGRANLLYYLNTVDLTDFYVDKFPVTRELREQQDLASTPEEDWLWEKLEAGSWFGDTRVSWSGPVLKLRLYENYLQIMTSINVPRPMTPRKFSQWLQRQLPDVQTRQEFLSAGDRPMSFHFPPLGDCRAHFAERRGRSEHRWQELTPDQAPLAQTDIPGVPRWTPPDEGGAF